MVWMFWMWVILAGGHINPAVTFGLLIARKVTLLRAVVYIVAQCLGAIVGAAIAKGIQGTSAFNYLAAGAVNGVQAGHSIPEALGAEIMGTFVLLFTVLSATDPQRNARDSHVPVRTHHPLPTISSATYLTSTEKSPLQICKVDLNQPVRCSIF